MYSVLALSVSGKIEQYGAYAGFASVLGLAVLSLLYFAQAREVKRLREWAGRAPERDAELAQRVQADASRRVVAQPQAQPRPAAQPAAAAAAGATAAGAAAPAPAPATPAAQPAPVVAAGPVQPGKPAPVPATATPVTAAGQAAVPATAAAAATAAGAATKAVPAAPPDGPPSQPTTVQPAAGGAANGAPTQPPRPGQPLRVPPTAGVPRATTPPGARATPPAEPPKPRRSALAIAAPIVGVLIVLGVAAAILLGGGSDKKGSQATNTIAAPPAQSDNAATPSKTGTTPLKPAQTTTAVLNGTTVPGLARGVANRLQNAGFKIGNVTNAADQSRSATLIEYAPGRKREALQVAKAIDVGSDAVQAMSPGSRSIAGEEALVVVTVGADQNQTPPAQQP